MCPMCPPKKKASVVLFGGDKKGGKRRGAIIQFRSLLSMRMGGKERFDEKEGKKGKDLFVSEASVPISSYRKRPVKKSPMKRQGKGFMSTLAIFVLLRGNSNFFNQYFFCPDVSFSLVLEGGSNYVAKEKEESKAEGVSLCFPLSFFSAKLLWLLPPSHRSLTNIFFRRRRNFSFFRLITMETKKENPARLAKKMLGKKLRRGDKISTTNAGFFFYKFLS